MHAYPRWKLWLILVVFLISIMGALPNFISVPSWWPTSMSKKMNLGLDLKGGIHLVLDVEVEKAVAHSVAEDVDTVRRTLRQNRIAYSSLDNSGRTITAVIRNPANTAAAAKLLSDAMDSFAMQELDGNRIVLTLKDKDAADIRKFAVQQAIEVVRHRIDALGTTEPVIAAQGNRRILVEIPGYENTARAKSLIGRTAELEFKLVDEKGDLDKALAGDVPPDDEIVYGDAVKRNGKIFRQPYLVKRRTELSGTEVTDARVTIDSRTNEYAVDLKFNNRGAERFDRLTSQHVGDRFAIILEGVVKSAPVIRERISGGRAQITGSFTPQEARDLAIVLRAGALPAPVNIVEERTIGPSLGQDSINKGESSTLYGFIAVVIFMLVYYRLFGLVANIALMFNLVLIVAAMSMIGSTLSLPGIAGIVLTIGMAVDANVLIFERIREEVRNGRTPFAAIDAGFDRAFVTIVDSNVTTLIGAVMLFQFGSGPVKGFAVTLTIGLLASMFTAITVTRAIIVLALGRRKRIERLSI
jgi:preprotein translocase subunit SecD